MLLLGPFQPIIAQAATLPTGNAIPVPPPAPTSIGGTATQAQLDQANAANQAAAAATPGTPASQNQVATGDPTTAGSGSGGQQNSPNICSVSVAECITSILYVFTVGIGTGFAYVAATFFNIAVNLSLNGPIYALTFISTGWTTARD